MRFCLSRVGQQRVLLASLALLTAGATLSASGELPAWMQDVVGASAIESALYRMMDVPGMHILYPRPPAESRNALSELVAKNASDAELYALRARADEQSLNFSAAEADWKMSAAHTPDAAVANLQLADFYQRRLQPQQEIAALMIVGKAPSPEAERFTSSEQQRSWHAFQRIVQIADEQALPADIKVATYHAWITRYPDEPSVRASLLSLLIQEKKFDEATSEISDYKRAFPKDTVFPLKASALIEYRRGSVDRALALYDTSFQPLWPAELVQNYFAMLGAAHQLRHMLSDARARLLSNPDDLASAARIFYYYQQEGHLDAARKSLDDYRFNKDQRKAAWSAEELYTFATLLDGVNQYDEAARYYFALYSATGKITADRSPQEIALAGILRILLAAPDQGISLGSGNLSIYRDIATVDSGPGYLNGILSLWLNSESPQQEFNEEEKRGVPYFHRAKAAELLAILDQKFPSAAARPELHADLIRAYADYGQDKVVIHAGGDFLKDFPDSSRRVPVAMLMADAYARTNDTGAEFALYERLLGELAAKSAGLPLSASAASTTAPQDNHAVNANQQDGDGNDTVTASGQNAAKPTVESALNLTVSKPVEVLLPDDLTYGQLLDRYLGRLTTANKLPEALAVLRRELDRNPGDPLLYERLAEFLEQNNLSAQEEEVYRRAMERFNSPDWYDKLARLFIRQKRRQDYSALTHLVVDTFRNSELESYFRNEKSGWPQIALEVNLYAHQRFPHDLTFTSNLLRAYKARGTIDPVAWEKLMREHWFESTLLTNQFFDFLSSHGKLGSEVAELQKLVPDAANSKQNPAATRELAEADVWQSHFEESAPLLGSLATTYPADEELGTEASSVYRSLAYFDPKQTTQAVDIEKNLLAANPANLDRLARIGDILADSHGARASTAGPQLAAAAVYWRQLPSAHPGLADGYLQSATVFWDYFQFGSALAEISAARKQFHDPALFGYEAGAIAENKREPAEAVVEYVGAALAGSEQAHDRLIALAARPASAQLVDAATAKAAAVGPTLAALNLRADVLAKLKEESQIAGLVDSAIDHATSFDEAEQLGTFAQQRELTASYQHALRREATLASDPVQHIEVQYALVQSLVAHDDVAAAEQVISAVYKENSKVIGVVRTTADFYWDHKQPQKAIAVLTQAAHDAYPELSHSYTLEAADKSNANGEYAAARQLVTPLLDADPYGANSARCLAIIADSYARAKDDAGLRDFYNTKLAALKSAQLTSGVRRDQAALLRRGLILALTRLKDYGGAVDQHTALISAFPEDDGVIQEASLYALRYGKQPQLLVFLKKAVADSPRDARFAIDLGRAETVFEDYPAAIEAYGKAIFIRKDRSDVYMARADLEERLQRFDEACADYDKLYFLSYKDPQWMVKTAEARARQGKTDLTVKALQVAWMDGRPAEAKNYFRVAAQLESWNLVEEARTFADQGVKLSGGDLLASPENNDGAVTYARILTRQRQTPEALKTLEAALHAAAISPSSPGLLMQQVEKQGIASVSDDEWRRNRVAQRKEQAATGFRNAVQQMSSAVSTYYTPEEKLSYAQLLDASVAHAPQGDVLSIWIPAALTAGLRDREAEWRLHALLNEHKFRQEQLDAFNLLEKQRMENAGRGQALENYADLWPAHRSDALALAEDAWRDEANHAKELAVLARMGVQGSTQQGAPQSNLRDRYLQLLLQSDPNKVVEEASASPEEYADFAANYVFTHGSPSLTYAAIDARAKSLSPVWHDANTALAGLYFADKSPGIDGVFRSALDDRNIGDRIKSSGLDSSHHLSGNGWFYYGMRYGVYRSVVASGGVEEYIASGLEGDPGSADSYASLAEAYADGRNTIAALGEYDHALELAPDAAALHRDVALLLWSAGKKDEALDQWRQALALLRKLVDTRAVPQSFWSDFAAIARDVRKNQMSAQLQPAMDEVLRAYIAKNGEYRSVELLQSAFIAADSPVHGVDWILSIMNAAHNPGPLLSQLDRETWLPKDQLGRVLRRELELAQSATRPTTGQADDSSSYLSDRVSQIHIRLLQYLLDLKQNDQAQGLYDSIPEKERQSEVLQRLRIILAAREGQIPKLLAEFLSDPESAPASATIADAANQLRLAGDQASNRLLLEYVFDFKSARHDLVDTDFLGLAQARIDMGDLAAATSLLHRFTLFSADLYASLDTAAVLLERSGHPQEAVPFLTTLATNTPWKPEYRLRLARAMMLTQKDASKAISPSSLSDLAAIASSSASTYDVRVQAANELKGRSGPHDFHSAELGLLASGKAILPDQADKPYFLPARLAAATTASAAQRPGILRKAIAIAPSDEIRLRIFRAEFALGHTELALTAIQPLLDSPAGYVQASESSAGSPDVADSSAENADDTNSASLPEATDDTAEIGGGVYAPMPSLIVKEKDKVDFALAIAAVDQKSGDNQKALAYARLASRLNRNDSRRTEISKRIAILANRVSAEQENDLRRPVIHASLDQAIVVRPRIGMAEAQEVQP